MLLVIHNFWTIGMLDTGSPGNMLLVIASLPVVLIFVVLPRVRDCDWPQWVGFLTIIPYLGNLTGIALLFAGSKVIGRSDDPDRLALETLDEPRIVSTGIGDPSARIPEESGAVIPHAGVCEEGVGQPTSLP